MFWRINVSDWLVVILERDGDCLFWFRSTRSANQLSFNCSPLASQLAGVGFKQCYAMLRPDLFICLRLESSLFLYMFRLSKKIATYFNKIRYKNDLKSISTIMEPVELVDSFDVIQSIIINSGLSKDDAVKEYLKQVKFPSIGDFQKDLEWFNVSKPLTFSSDLKGKIVVLDFFTYCCINCMHILPDLKEIEKEFSVEDGLVVVGVHSAKFENEKNSKNILAAVQRYNISHPVVNDSNSDMWQKCEVCCWPTLLLLGPHANPLVMLMGEGHKENLRLYVKNALEYYKGLKEISDHSIAIKSAYHLLPELKGPLLFPGKITNFIDGEKNEIIAVSDTGNHRILILGNDGTILKQFGKSQGFTDGNSNDARFNAPQGLAFKDKDTLFVADTENHAIRKIDLKTNTVETIAGNGKQGEDKLGGNIGKQQPISSPWDLCLYTTEDSKNILIIAMAGTHQIWALFLDDVTWWKNKAYKAGTCVAIAGNGREENRNNQYPNNAAFAQPSGLALCRKNREVYIADSESSSVRRLSLIDGKVTAVVGGDRNPNNLFAFGDIDGSLHNAKLQHVLGLAVSKDENTLYVADTYNHKLKKVDISKNDISSLKIPKASDTTDGATFSFNEPAGLCVSSDGKLLVADTNNHCIKIIDLDDQKNVKNVKVFELKLSENVLPKIADKSKYEIIESNSVVCSKNGGKLCMKIKFLFLQGLKISEGAPQKWVVDLPNASWSYVQIDDNVAKNVDFMVNIPRNADGGSFDVIFDLVTCTNDSCYMKSFVIRQNVQYSTEGRLENCNVVNVNLAPNKIELCKL